MDVLSEKPFAFQKDIWCASTAEHIHTSKRKFFKSQQDKPEPS